MVNMLDERDKLMETLRENQDQLTELRAKMQEVEKERDSLQRQLNANLPQVNNNARRRRPTDDHSCRNSQVCHAN